MVANTQRTKDHFAMDKGLVGSCFSLQSVICIASLSCFIFLGAWLETNSNAPDGLPPMKMIFADKRATSKYATHRESENDERYIEEEVEKGMSKHCSNKTPHVEELQF